MVYKSGRNLSEKEIDLFESASDIREIQYLGVRLIDAQCRYDPKEIARYAIQKGYASKLGYLAEISLEAARNLEKEKRINLTKVACPVKELIRLLYPHRNASPVFLSHFYGAYDERVLKKLDLDKSKSRLNKKWGIYSAIHPPDIEEYLELYLIDLRRGNLVREGKELIRAR